MKKNFQKKSGWNSSKLIRTKSGFVYDEDTLRRWKRTSTSAKLQWLEDAMRFFGRE